jgi:ribosomal protein S18 acetylase RimI-like enzyme
MSDIVFRRYWSGDRAAVRHICYLTGYMGDPVDWQWRDFESFADMFSAYYTDHEPEHAWVAEIDGEVRGYLLGCVDSTKAISSARYAGHHIVRRGLLFRPGTAGVLWRGFGDIFVEGFRRNLPTSAFHDPRWPAHLHIDLLPEARGQGVGAGLVRRYFEDLAALGVAGCHIETIAENTGAIAFFESQGFERKGRQFAAPGLRSPTGGHHHLQVMVRSLGPAPVTSVDVAESGKSNIIKPLVAAVGLAGTAASIWWFALRPRRKRRKSKP